MRLTSIWIATARYLG